MPSHGRCARRCCSLAACLAPGARLHPVRRQRAAGPAAVAHDAADRRNSTRAGTPTSTSPATWRSRRSCSRRPRRWLGDVARSRRDLRAQPLQRRRRHADARRRRAFQPLVPADAGGAGRRRPAGARSHRLAVLDARRGRGALPPRLRGHRAAPARPRHPAVDDDRDARARLVGRRQARRARRCGAHAAGRAVLRRRLLDRRHAGARLRAAHAEATRRRGDRRASSCCRRRSS